MSLRRLPPRPRTKNDKPAYPRVLAVASALLVSGCAIYPGSNSVSPEGDIAIPFEEDTGRDAGKDARVDAKPEVVDPPDVISDGTASPPYETGDAWQEDTADAADASDASDASDPEVQ